jgi:hypothetical protein
MEERCRSPYGAPGFTEHGMGAVWRRRPHGVIGDITAGTASGNTRTRRLPVAQLETHGEFPLSRRPLAPPDNRVGIRYAVILRISTRVFLTKRKFITFIVLMLWRILRKTIHSPVTPAVLVRRREHRRSPKRLIGVVIFEFRSGRVWAACRVGRHSHTSRLRGVMEGGKVCCNESGFSTSRH